MHVIFNMVADEYIAWSFFSKMFYIQTFMQHSLQKYIYGISLTSMNAIESLSIFIE